MTAPLTVFYRVTPYSNDKGRPAWFSKRTALLSLLAALEHARGHGPAELVFVADGGVPEELADLVAATGRVVAIRGGSAAASFRRLLALAPGAAPDPSGLLWFAEDDYIYLPEALSRLRAAAAAVPGADYFTLYTPDNADWHAAHPSQPQRRGVEERFDVGGTTWRRTYDATSTYGVHGRTLLQDRRLLQLASYSGSPWDHVTLLATQGIAPFSWRHLLADLYLRPSARAIGRAAARPVARVGMNTVVGLRRVPAGGRRPGRVWIAPEPDLATHVEQDFLSPDHDWAGYTATLAQPAPRS